MILVSLDGVLKMKTLVGLEVLLVLLRVDEGRYGKGIGSGGKIW